MTSLMSDQLELFHEVCTRQVQQIRFRILIQVIVKGYLGARVGGHMFELIEQYQYAVTI